MSQTVSAVTVKNNSPAPVASFKPSTTAATPATKDAKPATITSLNQPLQPGLGLFNNAGVVAKPAIGGLAATSSAGTATFVAGKDDVTVEIQKSDSRYDNKIYYSTDNFATKHLIGIDNQTGTVNLGKFAEGTKIEFGIQNGVNQFYRTGSAATNTDNFQHAQLSKNGTGLQIGFEDQAGGGDRDFNDAIITVRSVAAAGAAAKAPSIKAAAPKDNRSGLGDGTNPGQGAGRVNSPNQGTVNPNNAAPAKAPVPAPAPAAKAEKSSTAAQKAAEAASVVQAAIEEALKSNRSGLGDGSNPGQGAGSANSPNAGTLNPGGAVPAAVSKSAVAASTAAGKPATVAPVATRVLPAVAKPIAEPAKAVVAAPLPGTAPAPAPKTTSDAARPQAPATNNRSGLGDGTNPGQGAGVVNSPNQGSANPNNANTSAKPGLKV